MTKLNQSKGLRVTHLPSLCLLSIPESFSETVPAGLGHVTISVSGGIPQFNPSHPAETQDAVAEGDMASQLTK